MADLRATITADISDLTAKLQTVDSALRQLGATASTSAQETTQALGGVQQQLTALTTLTRASTLLQLGQQLTTAVTQPLVELGQQAILTADQFQRAEIAFRTMLGGAEQASAFLRSLQEFAARTPFEFADLVEASKRMMAFGFAAKDVIPTLQAVGDAVAGLGASSETMNRILLALGQIHGKGVVMTQELRQLAEAGIPVWDILAEKLRTDIPGAMQAVQKGAVDASTGITALLEGLTARFGGLMTQQSQTVTGALSNLRDVSTMVLGELGQELITTLRVPELLAQLTTLTRAFLDWFRGLDEGTKQLVLVFGGVFAASGPILVAVGAFMTALATLTAPLLVGGAIVAGIVAGVTLIALNWERLKTTGQALWSSLTTTVTSTVQRMVDAIDRALARLTAIFDGVRTRVDAVKGYFRGLYEAVVGRSYIPDMVEEIGQHMRLLDVRMVAPARQAAAQTGRVLEGAALTWHSALSQIASTANYVWGSMAQTVGQTLARMTDEHVRWGEVTKQIGLQALGALITQVIQLGTQWALTQLQMTAVQATQDAARVASATTATSTIAGLWTGLTALMTAAWSALTTALTALWTGFVWTVQTALLGLARLVVGIVSLVVAGVGTVLQAIGTVIGVVLTTIGQTLIALGSAMQSIPIIGTILGGLLIAMGGLSMAIGATLPGLIAGLTGALTAGVASLAAAIPALQHGGIVREPTLALLGEAGPEAVVPLDRGRAGWSGEQTIVLELDGRELARQVLPWMPGLVRLRVGNT